MVPTSFDQSNTNLVAGPESPPNTTAIAACKTTQDDGMTPVVITCWKMTREEWAEVQRTGKIWLVVNGKTQPPLYLAGESPFEVTAPAAPPRPSPPTAGSCLQAVSPILWLVGIPFAIWASVLGVLYLLTVLVPR